MNLGLQRKPFYFITDRNTHYQYLVDNRNKKSPKKYLYYPDEYQQMSGSQLADLKNKYVYQLLWWSLSNQDKLWHNDKGVINSTLCNIGIIVAVCMLGGKFFRKILFRNEMPVLETKLEKLGFNVRILKTLLSYSLFGAIGWDQVNSQLKQTHLVDLSFEYKQLFAKKMHSKADSLYEELWAQRIKTLNKPDLVV